MVKVVSWNTNARRDAIQKLLEMDADVALLQEVTVNGWKRLAGVGNGVAVTPYEPWLPWTQGAYTRWPLVVKLSDRVQVEWFKYRLPVYWPKVDEFPVSGIGTIAVARVTPLSGQEPFIAVSMYGRWRPPHPSVGDQQWIHADASAHRIISDLSVFISHNPKNSTHRILAAGDLNMAFFGNFRSDARMQTVMNRMNALGLEYLGPRDSSGENVPTYHTPRQDPTTATTQFDHVFASQGFHDSIHVRAMNGADEWGPSDHCRIVAEVSEAWLGLKD
ncbi:MAG: endonuclease/exonuclease/phosphatase family protein [Chloroflexota bacterium]|nr:endonuclease/exonuclease/phosphatase family protein [Chloroflexota bacterium]MDE2685367.1 endonuclease/exonuclease/phosphatase family protein [Chloroflexota bacterium]